MSSTCKMFCINHLTVIISGRLSYSYFIDSETEACLKKLVACDEWLIWDSNPSLSASKTMLNPNHYVMPREANFI